MFYFMLSLAFSHLRGPAQPVKGIPAAHQNYKQRSEAFKSEMAYRFSDISDISAEAKYRISARNQPICHP